MTGRSRLNDPRETSGGELDEDSRFVVGIDLGTTNCAACFVDTHMPQWRVETFRIPQWVDLGQWEARETLPSFHYELAASEASDAAVDLPWHAGDGSAMSCVGVLARDGGQRHPGRRIASAKSWLSHDGVDRSAEFLPWHGDPDVPRMSPVTASSRYLAHVRSAWDHAHPDEPLDQQDVVITLPASFDEVARELTIQAAKKAGLARVYLIEEPQAAFYGWIDRHRDDWPGLVKPGQLILVCDIGGGTTDLTLIRVRPAGASSDQVQFHRVAVGRHLILGGDNMDLAIAKLAEEKVAKSSADSGLSAAQWERLIQASRGVKETMLSETRPQQYTIHLAAEGSRLLAGAIQIELSAEEIDRTLLDGFFPHVSLSDRPLGGQSGFQEFGLPYAADPAVTRHLAGFLSEHRRSGLDQQDKESADRPDLVLFNGGVMAAPAIRDRIIDAISQWFGGPDPSWKPRVLSSPRLDLAVAQGAAYYAMVRRGKGVRIAANLARSYYMQVAHDPPAAICLIPGSAEAGERFRMDDHPLNLQIGAPVQFPLWVSSTRLADGVGQLAAIDRTEMSPLPPICTALVRGRRREEMQLNVFIESELSEIGTVGMYCVDADTSKRWKLDFDIRSTLETDRGAHEGTGEAAGIVDTDTTSACADAIATTFSDDGQGKPSQIIKQLQSLTETSRNGWPPSLLRELWQFLIDHESGRRKSTGHEARWLNMVGFCLRPGYGVAVDDWRVQQTWRRLHGKLAFPASQSRTESMILWRRIAGGLTTGQQQQIAAPLLAGLRGKSGRIEPHEAAETWRLIASLERLTVADKIELGDTALREFGRKKNEKLRPALLWALGRLGCRQPAYGPLNTAIPSGSVESWIETLIAVNPPEAAVPLTIVQLGRRTGDRYRDLSEETRSRTLSYLKSKSAPAHYLTLLAEGGSLDREEEAAVFGDSLPLGIRLVRS
jgi:molecular chaperone DnaK (HSP70)